jgi:hypothetical protein
MVRKSHRCPLMWMLILTSRIAVTLPITITLPQRQGYASILLWQSYGFNLLQVLKNSQAHYTVPVQAHA